MGQGELIESTGWFSLESGGLEELLSNTFIKEGVLQPSLKRGVGACYLEGTKEHYGELPKQRMCKFMVSEDS